ncbi:hypothetical protein PanWU01x14_307950 [Parasponia andersonii]|uniref:Uncharacterized protein n=1 Tax=Parasponia andersonii TaxID=3476 RepID=A0A2P5AR81_PARAD|nr:hypothetical protein PanWU01x14_307950 [Parasponia andersonii]
MRVANFSAFSIERLPVALRVASGDILMARASFRATSVHLTMSKRIGLFDQSSASTIEIL